MKRNYHFCTIAALLLTAFLLAMNGLRRSDEALASRIAPEILRFHVLANSNSPEDQDLKLAVKDYLLGAIQNDFASCSHITKDMVELYILDNKSNLETLAESFIEEMGFAYPAKISLESCDFPQKMYGDMMFPAGTYDAVRVCIGDGAGENFWCVLYPSLCYIDSTYAVVPDTSKALLQTLLPEEDFRALLTARRMKRQKPADAHLASLPEHNKTEQDSLLPRIKVRFKLAELFSL